jgi:outer membrane protein OmpA-like peptidoglycan-associated protein
MRSKARRNTALWSIVLALTLAVPAGAQSRSDREKLAAQSELTMAETALASAQVAGAATLATELYNDAADRLRQARANWNNDNRRTREDAGRRAVEARHAAAAAEAMALLLSTNQEIRNLRTDITNFGGTPMNVEMYQVPNTMTRGTTSKDRVIIAEAALRNARAAGAEKFAANELERLEANLKTARTLANADSSSSSADHLAYVAEMEARRLEYTARRSAVSLNVATLRGERTRLARQVADTRAADEQQRRLAAEQEAAALRRQLETVAANRQADQTELERLRQQMNETEVQFRARLEEDREARIAAERTLDDLLLRYDEALARGGVTSVEVEQLRRQVEDQQLALRSLTDRERLSETSMNNQIASLESALERERAEGRVTADVLASREQELQRQRDELARLQREREVTERRRAEAEQARATAIAEAERKRVEAENEAAALRQQVAQTSSALEDARNEIARRDAASQARITTMQQELSKLVETRETERGLIATLPGLFFDTGKAVLKPGARNTLAKIADQLSAVDNASITIEGHTDSVGSEQLNQSLSEKRAAAVRSYLVSQGVPPSRIQTNGMGEAAPVASNDTAAGRQQNRRVELVIATENQR